jgi:hypothetical protein
MGHEDKLVRFIQRGNGAIRFARALCAQRIARHEGEVSWSERIRERYFLFQRFDPSSGLRLREVVLVLARLVRLLAQLAHLLGESSLNAHFLPPRQSVA